MRGDEERSLKDPRQNTIQSDYLHRQKWMMMRMARVDDALLWISIELRCYKIIIGECTWKLGSVSPGGVFIRTAGSK